MMEHVHHFKVGINVISLVPQDKGFLAVPHHNPGVVIDLET
jgi:hypothetical protein